MSELPEGESSRFVRVVMEFEVEVVDEDALKVYDLHATSDNEGNFTGVIDMPRDERVVFALNSVAAEAWRDAAPRTGIRWMGGSTMVRRLDADGEFAAVTLQKLPARRDDGSYPDEV